MIERHDSRMHCILFSYATTISDGRPAGTRRGQGTGTRERGGPIPPYAVTWVDRLALLQGLRDCRHRPLLHERDLCHRLVALHFRGDADGLRARVGGERGSHGG